MSLASPFFYEADEIISETTTSNYQKKSKNGCLTQRFL